MSCLFLQFACACSLIVPHVEPSLEGQSISASSKPPRTVNLSTKSLFGYDYAPGECKEDSKLQRALVKEIQNSSRFEVAPGSGGPDLDLGVCFHEANDSQNVEGSLMVGGLTMGLIPTWYSRKLILEVTARGRDGSTRQYTETDSYTAINWLPLSPFASYWGSPRVFEGIARQQFRRVLGTLPR